MDFCSTLGSEGGAEVMEKWCIWRCFLIGFCAKLAQSVRAENQNTDNARAERRASPPTLVYIKFCPVCAVRLEDDAGAAVAYTRCRMH